MTDEAAKVINLSICKMAESRGVRRGGTSLHKHLLIASVLTKARSAYIEHLYFGDNEATTLTPLPSISTFSGQNASLSFDMNDSSSLGEDSDIANNSIVIDPSFFVEVEGEIDLPSDILNCVEKLTTITGEEIHFLNGEQQNSESSALAQNAGEMILANLSSIASSPSHSESSFLHLGAEVEVDSGSNKLPNSSATTEAAVLAGPIEEPKGIKRRRGWSFEEDHEYLNSNPNVEEEESQEYDDEGYSEEKFSFEQFLPQELNDKLKKNGISVTKNLTKRRRLSKSTSDIAASNNGNDDSLTISKLEDTVISPHQFSSSDFRTNQEIEIEETEENEPDEEDLFLDEDEVWGSKSQNDSNDDQMSRNDRRVPSASSASSGSGSDEEADSLNDGGCAMEVDQITSLVQYISFKQQQQPNSSSPSCPPPSPTLTTTAKSENTFNAAGGSGLTRSISTPDLCSIQKSRENTSSSPASNDHHHLCGISFSHRVLPLKVKV